MAAFSSGKKKRGWVLFVQSVEEKGKKDQELKGGKNGSSPARR